MQIIAGNGAGQWFPDGFVSEIIELLLATWEKLKLRDDVLLEPRITNLLNSALEEEYTRQGKTWYVHPEIKEADPVTGKEVSRTDIRFYHRDIPGQKLYFAWEAKRVHVESHGGTRGGYSEYTGIDGMMCFITGKYSGTAPAGGMIGYVMDGKLEKASKGISNAVEAHRAALKLTKNGRYKASKLMPKHPWNGETHHRRKNGPFDMYHVLLSVPKAKD